MNKKMFSGAVNLFICFVVALALFLIGGFVYIGLHFLAKVW